MTESAGLAPNLTKVTCPRANDPVMRPRLFQRLDALTDRSIVWMVGPPGAGKTTLAGTYLAQSAGRHLWYQVDAGDVDPATFFHYFRLALQQAVPSRTLDLPALTPEFLPGLPHFVRRYAEVMAANLERPSVCVLDNFEQVPADSPLTVVVREFAACLPPDMRFLVLSRSEPSATFARLQLYGQLAVVGGDELNLTVDEARELAAARQIQFGLTPAAGQWERLHAETQGWVAGFTLLLSDARDAHGESLELAGAPQLVFDYFATELFEHFPKPVQQGLLRTAVLPVLRPADVDRLSGNPEVKAVLAELQRRNCFVLQRGRTEPTYEYHALFRAFLLNRAEAEIAPEEWRRLQHHAADLLAGSRQVAAAAELYEAAAYWPGLSMLALREGPALISEGRHQTLDHWLRSLPRDAYQRTPWLSYWRGMARLPFDPREARDHFEQAYRGFRLAADVEGAYSAWAGVMDGFFYEWQDLRPADPWIAEFEMLQAEHPEFPSAAVELRTYWAIGTLLHRRPQHPFLPLWAERAEAILSVQHGELSVLVGGYLVIHHLWCGESSRALHLIRRLAPWTEAPGFPPMVAILWSCALGLYHSVRGDLAACLHVVEAALALAQRTGLTCWDFLLSAQAARCALVAGCVADAEDWIARMAANMRHHSPINEGFVEHLKTNAAVQRGEWTRAVKHACRGLTHAEESGVPFLEAHCRIDLARALIASERGSMWEEPLQRAEAIGEAMGSKVLRYLCRELRAAAAYARGDSAGGDAWLASALALGKEMDEPIWQMAGPAHCASLCQRALASGLETDTVRRLIRRRSLLPADPAAVPETWPWPVRIHTLGGFELFRDDELLRSSRKAQHKPLELIKVLCAFGGRAINQDRVAEALWPDAEGDAADQALATTLYRLRRLLQCDRAIRLEDRQLSLDAEWVWVDALAFERVARHPTGDDIHRLETALGHYRGHFLPGDSAPWALLFRERLRSQFLKLSERLGSLLEQQGDWVGAADRYRRIIEIEPVAEICYRRLMHCHLQLGERAEGLAVFRRCRQTLLSQLGISPTHETQVLHQRLMEE